MLLFPLAGVDNFCFNLLSPFLSIVRILSFALIRSRHFSRSYASSLLKSYRSKSFFTCSSHDFLGRPFFLFPVISSFMTSCIWELMSRRMTWPYHHRQLWIIISSIFTTTPTLSRRTSVDTLSTTLHIILIIQSSTPRNLASSAIVSSHV